MKVPKTEAELPDLAGVPSLLHVPLLLRRSASYLLAVRPWLTYGCGIHDCGRWYESSEPARIRGHRRNHEALPDSCHQSCRQPATAGGVGQHEFTATSCRDKATMSSLSRDPRRKDPRFPGNGRGELQRRRPVPPSAWSLRDKLSVGMGVAVALLAFFSPVILKVVGQRGRISQRLELWRTEFGLKVDQMKELKEIEYEFHGSGNPLSESRSPTTAEVALHNQQIASAMGPEAGKRYLEKQSGSNH